MKILFFTTGPELVASSRTRVYQYLPYLHGKGVKTKVVNYVRLGRCRRNIALAKTGLFAKILDRIFAWWQIIIVLCLVRFYNALFIQKVLLASSVIDLLKRLNDNIVFDFDDAVYLDDRFRNRFNHTLRAARYVIVENKYNESYVKQFNQNVLIITGPIDTSRYAPRAPEEASANADKINIGWIGSPETTKYVESLVNVFRLISKKHGNLIVTLIGASLLKIDGVNIIVKDWRFDAEARELQDLDIGIMPLDDDKWTRGKGGYKLLQYMACGIPCVASPVGVNVSIVEDGVTGFLAVSEKDWLDKLTVLIEDRKLRQDMGRRGRLRVEQFFSYEASLPKFMEILGKRS